MIPLGGEIKAWAITISDYGTIIETDEGQAQKKAQHYEGRGRTVVVTEMLEAPAKRKALRWDELTPGEYWAFDMSAAESDVDEAGLATITLGHGKLWIAYDDSASQPLNADWSTYQFVRCRRPRRSDVDFQNY